MRAPDEDAGSLDRASDGDAHAGVGADVTAGAMRELGRLEPGWKLAIVRLLIRYGTLDGVDGRGLRSLERAIERRHKARQGRR